MNMETTNIRAGAVGPMETIRVTIEALDVSPANVRTHAEDAADVEALAASILSAGLLQPPIVTIAEVDGQTRYLAEAGGRRVRALKLLVERGQLQAGDEIEVRIAPDGVSLAEISLAENFARKQLRPYEVYAAFAKVQAERPDATVAELSDMFGFDEKRTAKILRLASLHPTVFAAYAADKLSDAQAQAYAATEDQALQLAVFKQLAKLPDHQQRADNIRAAMRVGDKDEEKALRYVGDYYRQYGGRFEEDLFSDGQGIVLDPDILARVVAEKLPIDQTDYALRLNREVEWVSKLPFAQYSSEWYDLKATVSRAPLGAEDAERAAAIGARKDEIEALARGLLKKDGEIKRGKEAAAAELDEEYDALDAELEGIEKRRKLKLPKSGRILGLTTINHDGGLTFEFWFASRKEKGGASAEASGGGKVAAEKSPAERQRLAWGLNKDPMQAMLLLRREMIRDQLFVTAVAGSSVALDFLIYSQARTILRPAGKTWDGQPYIKGEPLGIETPASQDAGGTKPPLSVRKLATDLTAAPNYRTALENLAEEPWVTAHDPVVGWPLFRAAHQAVKDEAAAIVCAHGLQASTTYYGDGVTPRMISELANTLETENGALDWADTVTYDVPFFSLITHRARLALLDSWGLSDHAKGLKKADSAAFCARVMRAVHSDEETEAFKLGIDAEGRSELQLWRPEWLDTHPVQLIMEVEGSVPASTDGVSDDE